MSDREIPAASPQIDSEEPTGEVGSEGGSPGDIEQSHSEIGTGSEAGELWRPAEVHHEEVSHVEKSPGRRSP